MSYFEIFILGWFLNAFMLLVNSILYVKFMNLQKLDLLDEEIEIIYELQSEVNKYYPNKKGETLFSYLLPFTAFFKTLFLIIEMLNFFIKDENKSMYDFLIHKYFKEIERARAKY